ncbi:response regulator [Burkholderiaceae bacterium UC74_6]
MSERPIRILSVEDSENDFRLTVRLLRKAGFAPDCLRVQDLASFRQALVEQTWDAVISDFSMPAFSGMRALEEFRKTNLDVPFIFVSGTIGEETAVAAMQAGANDYVMKENMSRLGPALERELRQAARRAAHREAEAELSRFHAQLHQAQKMESLGTLAGGIAHDFNNILGAILGNIELVRADLEANHAARVPMEEIQRAAIRARDLVRQILTFSRRQPQQLADVELGPVVNETYRLMRSTLPAGVDLRLSLPDSPLYAEADATQIQQVLMNLCTNAWHALGGQSGRIDLGLECTELEATNTQTPGSLSAGTYVHLWVKDTGSGMEASTRERMFEPFFTTKPKGKGTGLGLSVVHGIVAAHRGGIDVDSVLGQGSTFHIYLPAVSALPAAAVAPVSNNESDVGHGEHVVYLDDDDVLILMVVRLLEKAGYRCTGFHDIEAAVAAAQDEKMQVKVFITDYNMAGRTGIDVARELARSVPELPVVICSGLISDELREHAQRLGVYSLIEKEAAFEKIVPQVAALLARQK